MLAVAAVEVKAVPLVVIKILELLVLAAAKPTNSAVSPIKLLEEHSEEAINESLNSETSEIQRGSNCDALSAVNRPEIFCLAILAVKMKLFFFPKGQKFM